MKRNSLPESRSLELNIFSAREEMGKAAAADVSLAMARFIREKGKVKVVFAAAPSQDEFLSHLSKNTRIDWSRVICFHLDDYVDLPRFHPNTFEMYLKEHLFDFVNPGRIYFLKALQGNPAEVSRKYAEQIRRSGGIDISCIGIGENGHIAFCEPGSDLNDPQMIRVIRINDRSVRQQFRDYKDHPNPEARYSSFQAVPRRAFTDDRTRHSLGPGNIHHGARGTESRGGKKDVGRPGLAGLSILRPEKALPGQDLFGPGFGGEARAAGPFMIFAAANHRLFSQSDR